MKRRGFTAENAEDAESTRGRRIRQDYRMTKMARQNTAIHPV
jgi:hypothetical protein